MDGDEGWIICKYTAQISDISLEHPEVCEPIGKEKGSQDLKHVHSNPLEISDISSLKIELCLQHYSIIHLFILSAL